MTARPPISGRRVQKAAVGPPFTTTHPVVFPTSTLSLEKERSRRSLIVLASAIKLRVFIVSLIQKKCKHSEKYVINPFFGYTRRIETGGTNFLVIAFAQLAVLLPAAPFWEGEEGFNFVFGMAPRIAVASLIAFLAGSFLNAYVMSKMKIASNGKNFSLRAIVSTLIGESADSLIFFPIAFAGLIPAGELLIMIGTQAVLKSLYEVIILPVTIRVVK